LIYKGETFTGVWFWDAAFGEETFEKVSPPYPLFKTFTAFYFFLGKLLKKFSQTLSKLSQHFLLRESFYFLCRTLGTADSFQVPPP